MAEEIRILGNAYQKQYTKNLQLLPKQGYATPSSDSDFWYQVSNCTKTDLADGWCHIVTTSNIEFSNIYTNLSAVDLKPGTNYTLLIEWKGFSGTANGVNVTQYNTSEAFASNVYTSVGSNEISSSMLANDGEAVFVYRTKDSLSSASIANRIFIRNTNKTGNSTIDLRVTLVEGDRRNDIEWQPYVGGVASPNPDYPQNIEVATGRQVVKIDGKDYELNLGKNLLQILDVNYNGVQTTVNNDGSVNMKGTTAVNYFNYTAYRRPLAAPLHSGTYTFSVNKTWTLGTLVLQLTNKDDTRTIQCTIPNNGTSATVDVPFDIYYFSGNCGQISAGTAVNIENLKIQFERGGEATEIAPYFAPLEIRKAGQYQDYLYKGDSGWAIHREVNKLITPTCANMDHNEAYPGWNNQPNIYADMGNKSVQIGDESDFFCNITPESPSVVVPANNKSTFMLYPINTTKYGMMKQSEWQTNYPNLQCELYYGIVNEAQQANISIASASRAALIQQLDAIYDAISAGGVVESVTSSNNAPVIVEYPEPPKVFRYWAKNGVQYFFNEPVTENFTLEGVWSSIFTVKFVDSFGETVAPDQQVIEASPFGLTMPPDPVRSGYTFEGWYAPDGHKWNNEVDMVTSNMTLTAVFTAAS